MCGICGFTGDNNPGVLDRMMETLRHRGPDGRGRYADGRINLAMRRLSIVDIESGNQPICNEDRSIWVVLNGEIYNHEELRKQLESRHHLFRTDHSDTETLVHLYEEFGINWPTHVNGMFGMALWDGNNGKLLLYRDRIGKKPLYYAVVRGQLIFASEIKAILQHPDVSRDLDYSALYHYFGNKNISAPQSAYADIKQLPPGYRLVWQNGTFLTEPYWQVNFGNPLTDISEDEAANHLFTLFEDAVKIRMQCDAPYGAYLSGGVDSSAVVSMMSRHQSIPIKTFCLGYTDPPEAQFAGKAQDLFFARKVAQLLGTEHYEFIIDAHQFAAGMPEVLSAFDEPFSGTVSTFFLSILMQQHIKVALSGDGADELFGSYLAHRLAIPIENFYKLGLESVAAFQDLTDFQKHAIVPFQTPEQYSFLRSVAAATIDVWRNRLVVFTDDERRDLLNREFLALAGEVEQYSIFRKLGETLRAKDALNRALEMDQKELLPNQVLPFVDRLSMAHSIEVRVPYLDYRIIEFANRLPGEMKIKNGVVKYIHKRALSSLLPEELLTRPKEGFVQPIYSWLHGELKGWGMQWLESLPFRIFNKDYLSRLCGQFAADQAVVDAKVWNLICFSIWYNEMIR